FEGGKPALVAAEPGSVLGMAEVADPSRGEDLWVARRSGLVVIRGGQRIAYDANNSGLRGKWQVTIAVTPRPGNAGWTWVGGWAGLARFDGERFIPFDQVGGVSGYVDSISSLVRRGRQELWLAMP